MSLIDAQYWQQPASLREPISPLSDTRCVLCRESLEGQTFIEWQFGRLWGSEDLEIAGMHLGCAYIMTIGIFKDLMADWNLDPTELNELLAEYMKRLAARDTEGSMPSC